MTIGLDDFQCLLWNIKAWTSSRSKRRKDVYELWPNIVLLFKLFLVKSCKKPDKDWKGRFLSYMRGII